VLGQLGPPRMNFSTGAPGFFFELDPTIMQLAQWPFASVTCVMRPGGSVLAIPGMYCGSVVPGGGGVSAPLATA